MEVFKVFSLDRQRLAEQIIIDDVVAHWVQQRFAEQIPAVVDVPVITQLQFQQSLLYDNVEVPQIQFIVRVPDLPGERSIPTVQTVLKTVETHGCCSWLTSL